MKQKPIIIINFKTYKQGKEVLRLVKAIQKVSKDIIVGVQATDIKEVSKKTKIQTYAQHVEHFEPGRNTGYVLLEAIKSAGAKGVFLNHSEHKLDFSILKETVKRCRNIGLKIVVFASDLKEAGKVDKLKPDFLIVEPPELVAGNVSVSKAKPELIKRISKKLKTRFLVGAGIKNSEDVKKALELGASGIAVSSAVTLAKNPEKKLKELFG